MAAFARAGHPIGIAQLHELHRAVQTGAVVDSLAPVGRWKVELNGTTALTTHGTSKWHDYAAPALAPALVGQWLALLVACCRAPAVLSQGRAAASPRTIDRAAPRLMGDYSLRRGRPHPGQALVRRGRERSALVTFFAAEWRSSMKLVREYQARQQARQRPGPPAAS